MPYAVRVFECAGCGATITKRAGKNSNVRCINCSIARSIEAVYQLRDRRGDMYQKWARNLSGAMVAEQVIAATSEIIENAS